MAELVSSMRLAQQYGGTVVAGEYNRAMLSSARTLALNSKKLLDIIDAIRATSPVFTTHRSPPDGATGDAQTADTRSAFDDKTPTVETNPDFLSTGHKQSLKYPIGDGDAVPFSGEKISTSAPADDERHLDTSTEFDADSDDDSDVDDE